MRELPDNPLTRARDGLELPSLGLGTWMMGMDATKRSDEVAALRLGLDLGMTLIDTAENYGDGGSEQVVGEAIQGRRDEVVLVTKVRPDKASRAGAIQSTEESLRRLGTDCIDLLLLHDPPKLPLGETLEAFETLKREGKIRHHGVSNFDAPLMHELEQTPLGSHVGCNQLRYALTHRALEDEILPWCEAREIAIMAYSPVGIGRLSIAPALEAVARRHERSPMCIAIAWAIRHPLIVAIPKASNPEHVRENVQALSVTLSQEDLDALDAAYPPPPPGSFDVWES